MKTVKRISALLLCAVIALTCLTACHNKSAVVATCKSGDKEYSISSGLYLTFLISADSQARSKVTDALEADGKETDDVNFAKQKVKDDDGKEYGFYDYVNKRAKELAGEYVATLKLFDQYSLTLSDEDKTSLTNYSAYQWSYSGNQYIFEPNGVSEETFTRYLTVNMFERSAIFDHLYGEEGEKAPAKADIEKALKENFTIANLLEFSTKDDEGNDLSEGALDELAKKIEGYCDRINGSKATFADIKAEFEAESGKTDEEESQQETQTEEESDKPQPADKTVTVYGSDKTSVSSGLFEDIKGCELNKATLLKSTDGSYRLVVQKDILGDEYYFTTYRDETVRIAYADEFNKFISDEASKLDIRYNSYELNYLKPKKISYDQYNEWYQKAISGMVG